jgi:succinyl-CoA synthetase alpha subunit/citrate synthase
MRKQVTKPFPWFVGVHSLEELATRESRVCVINILGSESRSVTPVSHAYSGGNVVAGVQYGRTGVLETPRGDIPVYQSVREVLAHGHHFDVGVVYLPPLGVAQAVAELVRTNEDLKRIVVVTEKVPAKDSAAVRALCQEAGVDVIGANSLGVANAWDQVRIGGSLGGDRPAEALRKGSIAIHSNSGNFTTTMSEYLRTAGFGISTAVSSGKDVYIHFALPEFLWAAQNDPRTKAVVLYVEPGGYYERIALDLVLERRFGFTKPIVCCVTGRWRKEVNRTCGHAGALAGSGEDAESKERWFDDYFGVPVLDPKNPVVSRRGVRVSSIQFIPDALRAVFEKMGEAPDFEPKGDLSLKPWLADRRVALPPDLAIPTVRALAPYDEQIAAIATEIGAHYLRQNMADRSGASRMSRKTQVAELHGKTVLDLSQQRMEDDLYFALAKVPPAPEDGAALNLLLNALLPVEDRWLDAVDAARGAGALPNAYLAARLAAIGDDRTLASAREHARALIDTIRELGLEEELKGPVPPDLDARLRGRFLSAEPGPAAATTAHLLAEVRRSTRPCVALQVAQRVLALAEKDGLVVRDLHAFLLATLAVCAFWKPLLEKRLTRQTVEDAVAYVACVAQLVASSVVDRAGNPILKKLSGGKPAALGASFTENAFRILFGRTPDAQELMEFRTVVGLTVTNGPGTLSAKGAKEAVSARNDISMSFVGFLSHTGRAHGGNGVEAVEFLLRTFEGVPLQDPGRRDHGIDLAALANRTAKAYGAERQRTRESREEALRPIPCVNHPVFRGQDVNVDPREQYVRGLLEKSGVYNVFLDFYHHLVRELFAEGVTRNVFCVNVDAVIAVITLKLVWKDLREGRLALRQVQEIGFLLFLFGRAVGSAAEIADHRDRGLDMDCRTPEDRLEFVM